MSPSATSPIGPPTAASGATWPMQGPRVPPENRPSVTSTTRVYPSPIRAEVGESISGMPGPPRGPSYRITTTSPSRTWPERIAAIATCSPS